MTVTASRLRADIYTLLDRVIETGEPLEIERNGHLLRVVPVEPESRMARLVRRPDYVCGDPDELVHLDWSTEWRG